MKVAVVLPTLNESTALPSTLRSLAEQTQPPDRLVVVDGGSADDTVEVARRHGAGVMVVAGRGRGGQIAAGVAECREDIIVVAHADMIFPPTAIGKIREVLTRRPACPGGCVGHRFDSPKWAFRAIEWWDRRRAIRGYSYGDQAQFFRPDRIGKFPELPIMEDVELARRLRRQGRPVYLDLPVIVSPRRYERLGWPRVMRQNWQLRRMYARLGPDECWRLYRRYYAAATQGGHRSRSPRSPTFV
jgi:glycosyltransferase involved in cell wall biosynthesis